MEQTPGNPWRLVVGQALSASQTEMASRISSSIELMTTCTLLVISMPEIRTSPISEEPDRADAGRMQDMTGKSGIDEVDGRRAERHAAGDHEDHRGDQQRPARELPE